MASSNTSGVASSTTGTSAVTTGSIDVASIVSQLMTVENQPLDTLKAKITSVQTQISDLGTMKSKLSSLQSALISFEDPSTYNNPVANSSDSSVITASASSNAAIGSFSASVTQLATATQLTFGKPPTDSNGNITAGTPGTFSSAKDLVNFDLNQGFSITVGTADGQKTFNTNDPANKLVSTGSVPTLTELKNWINGLGVNVQANIVQTISPNDFVLQINGTQTGLANAISVNSSLGNYSASTGSATGAITEISNAQDAVATIGGIQVNRSSNTISDVINGVTFNLVGKLNTSANITVQQGPDTSSVMINTLIKAYNDVVTQYNSYTANSNSIGASSTTTNGDFATNPTMLSFVSTIKSLFANGATDTTSATVNNFDATKIDLKNGYLKINNVKYNFSTISTTNPTSTDFVAWVNSLGAGVTASVSGSNVQLSNSQTGGSNSIDFYGFNQAVTHKTLSLSGMGMDIQLDGTIQFNTSSYQQAVTQGLVAKLSKGLKIGFSDGGSSLNAFLTSEIDPATGALVSQISTQQTSVTTLQKKQTDLQDHLAQVQNNYISQYSALNALLFQLNSTSNSLANALLAVTNINAGK